MTAEEPSSFFSPGGRRALLQEDGLVLLLDGGNPRLRCALLRGGEILALVHREASAEEGLCELVKACLGQRSPLEIDTFLYQAGPGSLLGLRIAAMLVEGWRAAQRLAGRREARLRFYHHAEWVAEILKKNGLEGSFSLGSDARRKSWNVLEIDSGGLFSWQLKSTEDWMALNGKPYFLPQGFCSQKVPGAAETLAFAIAPEDFALFYHQPLTGELTRAEPALLRSSEYVRWSGGLHQKGT